ncbi:MAG: hypothetical protein QF790_06530 [Gammaproteobacteria bacterium]|jgi:hypothetical protein|nr:hypothetical protein [Gammaproteobacteria bacterium]MDP6616803.1 hypothetical protein [Gammaproteobacteria bacterium]MDP6696017.1 hypothetical protein [Gammaproteobacteria bacterium]
MTKQSTMKPFAPGDIFLGCTYLCDPDDDHKGDGRILQYDKNLVPKGTLYTEGTSHLIVNCRFGPDGTLWAFDGFEYTVVRVSPDGTQLPNHDFGERAWGNVCFGPERQVYLGEYLNGDKPYEGGDMRTLPGTNVVGYGHIGVFASNDNGDFNPVCEYEPDLSPSMTGFHGVTHTCMHPDGRTFTYLTDLGMRVMRYDVVDDKQLPDLVTYPGGEEYVRKWTTGVDYLDDGTLLLLRGSFIDFIGPEGQSLRTIELDEYGYAMITISKDQQHVFVANIFTGVMSKVDLDSGEILGQIDTGLAKPQRSLAGVAVYEP